MQIEELQLEDFTNINFYSIRLMEILKLRLNIHDY